VVVSINAHNLYEYAREALLASGIGLRG